MNVDELLEASFSESSSSYLSCQDHSSMPTNCETFSTLPPFSVQIYVRTSWIFNLGLVWILLNVSLRGNGVDSNVWTSFLVATGETHKFFFVGESSRLAKFKGLHTAWRQSVTSLAGWSRCVRRLGERLQARLDRGSTEIPSRYHPHSMLTCYTLADPVGFKW